MRMRKLEKDQSIMFCKLIKVKRKIIHYSDKTHRDVIKIANVLQ